MTDIDVLSLVTVDSSDTVVLNDVETQVIEVSDGVELIEVSTPTQTLNYNDSQDSFSILTETIESVDVIEVGNNTDLVYGSLEGPQGIQGPPGPKGDPGVGFDGLVTAEQIDSKGLNILDTSGEVVFNSNGEIANDAYININGTPITLSEIASNSLVPTLNFVGSFNYPPIPNDLGAEWKQNAVYKNNIDGKSYVLTGLPLQWYPYLTDGSTFLLNIESSNGTVFRVGQNKITVLSARLFKNGAEITEQIPATAFQWFRSSMHPREPPYDDNSWNYVHSAGYKSVVVSIDDISAKATFTCQINF